MSMSFEEALNNNIISQSTYDMIPKACRCGSPLLFSDSLRELRCSNPKCREALAIRLKHFVDYNNLSLTFDDCYLLTERLNIVSPYQLVMLKDAVANKLITTADILKIYKVTDEITELLTKEFYIYQLLEMCGIHEISSIASKIAFGFNTMDELYNEIDNTQVAFINDRLGIVTSDSCTLSLDVYNKLLKIKEELYLGEALFKIKEYNNRLHIAFCDKVSPYVNKSELLSYLKSTFSFTFVHRVLIDDTTDILIKHLDNTTSRYRNARLINDKFVAEQVNNNMLKLAEVGAPVEGQLKPQGTKIYITTTEELIRRLTVLEHGHK